MTASVAISPGKRPGRFSMVCPSAAGSTSRTKQWIDTHPVQKPIVTRLTIGEGRVLVTAVVTHHVSGYYALDLHDDDIFWCTADPGWVA